MRINLANETRALFRGKLVVTLRKTNFDVLSTESIEVSAAALTSPIVFEKTVVLVDEYAEYADIKLYDEKGDPEQHYDWEYTYDEWGEPTHFVKTLNGAVIEETFYGDEYGYGQYARRVITYGENGQVLTDIYYDREGNEVSP